MKSYINRLLTEGNIITGTVFVTTGSLLAGIFNYILQVMIGRNLSVADYGVFNALLSLSLILSIPFQAISQSLIKTVSELKAHQKFETLTNIFVKVSIGAMLLGLVFFLAVNLLKESISEVLKVKEMELFVPFGFYLGLTFLGIAPTSYLQGLLRFKAYSLYLALGGILRLAIPLSLVLLGYRVGGLFWGFGLVGILLYFTSLLLLKKNFRSYEKMSLRPYYKDILQFGTATFFVVVGMTLLNNIDVIMVKHFFSDQTTGIYSAIVTVGKIFLFGAGTVTLLMYPQISELYTLKKNYLRAFRNFFFLQSFLTLCGLTIFTLIPEFIVTKLFGISFLPAVIYLPQFAIFIAIYVIINFMIMFLLAINQTRAVVLLVLGAVVQFLLLLNFHSSLSQVIAVNIMVSFILLLTLTGYSIVVIKNN